MTDLDSSTVATREDCCHGNDVSVEAVWSVWSWCRDDSGGGSGSNSDCRIRQERGVFHCAESISLRRRIITAQKEPFIWREDGERKREREIGRDG